MVCSSDLKSNEQAGGADGGSQQPCRAREPTRLKQLLRGFVGAGRPSTQLGGVYGYSVSLSPPIIH